MGRKQALWLHLLDALQGQNCRENHWCQRAVFSWLHTCPEWKNRKLSLQAVTFWTQPFPTSSIWEVSTKPPDTRRVFFPTGHHSDEHMNHSYCVSKHCVWLAVLVLLWIFVHHCCICWVLIFCDSLQLLPLPGLSCQAKLVKRN